MRSGAVNFVRHIRNMVTADGKRRVIYSFANIIVMAIAVAAVVGIKLLLEGIDAGNVNFVAGAIAIIILIVVGVYSFLQGFVSQLALVIIAATGFANPEQRGANVAAFVIAFITSVGLIIAAVILLLKL